MVNKTLHKILGFDPLDTWAPHGYKYDYEGNLILEQMAGDGKPYAPKGFTYNKHGNLIRLKDYKRYELWICPYGCGNREYTMLESEIEK